MCHRPGLQKILMQFEAENQPMVLEQLRQDERRWDDPWGERKSDFMQENSWRKRQPSKWAENEKEMPEIHVRVGPGKLSLVFSSMSFRNDWGKSGEIGNKYFHSPLVPWLETANGLLLPSFLSPPLFSQQTKSCIRLLLGFLYFVIPVRDCYFLNREMGSYEQGFEQGLMLFVSPPPSQIESLTPRMPRLC